MRAAAARGVQVMTLRSHYLGTPALPGFVIGFGGIDLDRIPEGLARLRDAVDAG